MDINHKFETILIENKIIKKKKTLAIAAIPLRRLKKHTLIGL